MSDEPQRLAGRMRSEGEKTLAFFQALPPGSWEQTIYSEGGSWRVRELLAHFTAAETAFTLLFDNVLSGGEGAPADFDLDAYNERRVQKLQDRTVDELLASFAEQRRLNAERVSAMTPADLQRTARHPWLGMGPLNEMVKLVYRHNQIHQRDIRKALGLRD